MKVTCEGIETEAQRRFLEATGCQSLQGFLLLAVPSPPTNSLGGSAAAGGADRIGQAHATGDDAAVAETADLAVRQFQNAGENLVGMLPSRGAGSGAPRSSAAKSAAAPGVG